MRYNPKEFNASTKKLFESAEYSEIQKRAWAEYNLLLVKTQADILPKVIDFLKTNNVEEGKSVTFYVWNYIMALAIAEMTFSIGDRLIKQEADEFVAEIERLYTRLFSEGPGILQEYRKPHPEAEHFKPSIVFWRQISRLAGRSQAFRPTSVAPLTLAISSLEIEVTAYCLQANLDELKEHVLRVRTQLFDRIARAEELEQEKEKI